MGLTSGTKCLLPLTSLGATHVQWPLLLFWLSIAWLL